MVGKESAVIDGSEEIGFEEKHRGLQRFTSREDKSYKSLLFWIKKMLEKESKAKEYDIEDIRKQELPR